MKNTLLLCLCLLSLPFSAQNRYYVDDTAGGQNTGASWADALTDLQTALALAQSGDEVWVAEGTYLPTTGADRNISFQPASGVRLYGGFAGTESAPDERDWEAHPTVLSGDIGAPGDSTDNTYNVVYLYQPDAGTLLDGFTICFGNADFGPGAGNERDRVICGGGLYMDAGNWDALATIQYCRFWRNTALSYGGGAMVTGSTAAGVAPKWLHCRFEENRSAGSGGGLARFGGSWEEQGVDFEACDFIGNRAGFLGGGLYYSDSQGPNTVMINQCVFEHNFAVSRGGGAFLLMGKAGLSGLVVNGCDFDSNASTDGAALDVFPNLQDYTGNFSIEDCIFQKNNINYSGEKRVIVYIGIFGSENTTASINNAIFEHNQSEESLLIDCYNSNVIVDNVEFYSNQASRIIVTFSATSQFFTNIQFNSNITGLFYGLDSNQETVSYVKNCICINNEPINQNIIYFNPTGIFDSLIVTNFTIDDSSIANEISTVETNFIAQNMVVNSVNNLFTHRLTQYDISHSSFNLPDCSAFPPNVTCGPGNLFGLDPMFRDTANGDYSLLPCSPLRNRGNNAAAAGILTDIAGMP
ncbi:MAG: hypothetical protein SFV22_15965, partial [Saprospiraceae bacterium]|nr:hypothetical protein [Saprospiraceae bacterium]